jgi:hypothetical protein
MKPIFTMLLSASAASCMQQPSNVDGIPDDPVTRAIINDFLDLPRQPPPLAHRLRSKLFPTATDRAFRLEREADIVIYYSSDGLIRIDNGPTQSPVDVPDELRPPSQWVGLFDSQPKKSMVVVVIAKNVWKDEELGRQLSFLNRYFTDRGYRRIVIQQARAAGRPTHSDITVRAGKQIHFTSAPGIRRGLTPLLTR